MYMPGVGWPSGRRKQASFGLLATFAVGALLFACYSFVQWQISARDAGSYASAPDCGGAATTGCKRQVPVTVTQTYERHYSKSDHEFVSLQGQDGSTIPDV